MTAGTLLVLCNLWELIKATQAMVAFRELPCIWLIGDVGMQC